MYTIADVIIPAFTVPYAAGLLFPLAGISVLIIECIVFKLTNRNLLTWWKAFLLTLGINVFSSTIGFIISMFLPNGLEPKLMGSGEGQVSIIQPNEHWMALMYIAFPVAYVLSILFEYGVIRAIKRIHLEKAFRTVVLANTLSYVSLILISYIWAEYVW